jgi:heptose I phosphotransferase
MRLLERFREQLQRRRHVVEKSQAPRESTQQTWQKIEGEELCVASALEEVLPGDPGWLSLRRTGPQRSRWLASPEGMPLRLQRRRHRGLHLRRLFAWFRGREYTPPEQKRAHLLLRLERYHVPVPKVLAMGRVWQGVGSVEAFLLTCPLPRTLNLDQWLDRCSNPTQRQVVLSSLGQLLRKMHSAGCYLDSALSWRGIGVQLTNGGPRAVLQWVDGLRLRRRLQERPARADLTRCLKLLRHLGCGESECRAFVNAYDHAGRSDRLHIPMTASVVSDSQGEATMTESTALLATETPRSSPWSRFWAGARRLWQQSDWTRYVGGDWIRTIMSRPVTDRFSSKQGRSTGRMILPPQPTTDDSPTEDAEPLRIYLKRHYQLPWVNRLLALLWPSGRWSPAMQEMHHLEKARRLGVPVPEVVAAGEFIGPGFQLQSFLAVKELTGMLPLHEAIPLAAERLSPEDFARWKRGLILEMARLCRLLHDRNWFHKDLYLCHFYIDESFTHAAPNDWRDRVVMIDLHRLGHHPWTWAVWQMKDLAQLLYSSEITGITDRDRLLFWRAYQGPKPRPWWDPWLRWLVVLKWRRYRAHNLRHAARRAIEKQELAVPALTTEDQA